ncbi:MAG: ABC transporter ATP-binding protein, partial [Anaerolineales bacterium]|nr:ABC transporter ATP-binding protein [Anaerolineales bacterium]
MNIPFKQYWDLLGKYIQPQKGRFYLLTFLLLSTIGLQILNPQIMRYFIDQATAQAPLNDLVLAAALFIAAALVQQVMGVSATYVGENVAWTATNALRAELAEHCLHLDMSFHNEKSPGELIERIDGDVIEISNFFSQLVIRVLGNLLLLLGIMVAIMFVDWRVGIAFSTFVVIMLFVLNKVRGLAIPHQKAFREANAELFGFLEERLAGTEDIRSSGAVDFVLRGLYKLQTEILKHWRNSWRMFLLVRSTAGYMMVIGNVIAFISGYFLYRNGTITLGTAYLIIYYTNLLGRPVRELEQQVENLQNIGASTLRLIELRAIESKTQDGPGVPIPTGALHLSFDHVDFAYHEDEPVLHDLSFQLEPGKVLGILGRTGSGKTTITRLVFRLYDPTTGQVTLNDVPIQHAELRQLRQSVGMVTQDVQLFQASVRDNLTFFDHTIPDERIMAVIEELELSDWFQSLPDGLDTELETGGRGLSAGEGQLLAFTRVFLRDPGLVILDEASSRL